MDDRIRLAVLKKNRKEKENHTSVDKGGFKALKSLLLGMNAICQPLKMHVMSLGANKVNLNKTVFQ